MTHGWQVVVGKMLPFDWPDPFSSRPWTWARNLSWRIGWRSRCGLRRPRCRWPESPFRRTPDCCRTSTVSVDISFFNFSQQQQLKKSTSTRAVWPDDLNKKSPNILKKSPKMEPNLAMTKGVFRRWRIPQRIPWRFTSAYQGQAKTST